MNKQTGNLIIIALLGLIVGFFFAAVTILSRQMALEVRAVQESKKDVYIAQYDKAVKEALNKPSVPVLPEIKFAKVTAYSCGGLKTEAEILMNCPSLLSGGPKTASGSAPIPYKTVACDRANMGKVFELEGIGLVKCTDTGGAIKGAGRFDLYVSDVHEARKWGVQQVAYREAK